MKRSTVVAHNGSSVLDDYRTSYGTFIKCVRLLLLFACHPGPQKLARLCDMQRPCCEAVTCTHSTMHKHSCVMQPTLVSRQSDDGSDIHGSGMCSTAITQLSCRCAGVCFVSGVRARSAAGGERTRSSKPLSSACRTGRGSHPPTQKTCRSAHPAQTCQHAAPVPPSMHQPSQA